MKKNLPMPKQCDIYDKNMEINNGMSSFFLYVPKKVEL